MKVYSLLSTLKQPFISVLLFYKHRFEVHYSMQLSALLFFHRGHVCGLKSDHLLCLRMEHMLKKYFKINEL